MKKKIFRIASLFVLILFFTCCNPKESGISTTQDAAPAADQPSVHITFLSTQMNPVEEAGKMVNVILKDFPGKVDFMPNDNSYVFRQIDSILRDNPSESILVGATHGDLTTLYEKKVLRPLNRVFIGPGIKKIPENLLAFGQAYSGETYYIPWMRASFIMAANKKALAYLPQDSSIDELTYDQFYLWTKNIFDRTGRKYVGFPAGRNGLMHRFLQGYLYPSFTASTLLKFRSEEAMAGWIYLKKLWEYVNPGSLTYSTMAEPLLTEDVWIAWDHTARFLKAFKNKPDDFVAFPAPAGPKGRGFMEALSGLAIPSGVADTSDSAALIDYLTQPETQNRTFRETGFFPVVESPLYDNAPPYLQELKSAVDKQSLSPISIPTLLPVGLGEHGNDYNDIFMLTFSEIVLEGKRIWTVLNSSAKELQEILDANNVKCWLPDVSEERPCKIE